LHHAAESRDRGSTAIMDALLAAGARRDALTRNGATAEALAR